MASVVTSRRALRLIDTLACRLSAQGLDLLQPFCTSWFHISTHFDDPKCDTGTGHLGVLVGNSKALWKPFVQHLARSSESDYEADCESDSRHTIDSEPVKLSIHSQSGITMESNPLDSHVKSAVHGACVEVFSEEKIDYDIHYSFDTGDRFVDMQRCAEAARLAHFDKSTYLCIHPTFGPWFALRAAIVLDMPYTLGAQPSHIPSPCIQAGCAEQQARQCTLALQQANLQRDTGVIDSAAIPTWKRFLEVRDACNIGREHRYCENQIGYHYTKDRKYIRAAIQEISKK
jgi:cyanocobalamin reductase (cyanide-eliminating) / alkylcobalamin dealkylase